MTIEVRQHGVLITTASSRLIRARCIGISASTSTGSDQASMRVGHGIGILRHRSQSLTGALQ